MAVTAKEICHIQCASGRHVLPSATASGAVFAGKQGFSTAGKLSLAYRGVHQCE